MRVLVLYANPKPQGLCAALHDEVSRVLCGHHVDDVDLYAEQFDPVKPLAEVQEQDARMRPGRPTAPLPQLERHIDLLKRAEAIVLVFPVWHFGFPAILKGYIDRVCLPEVAYRFENGRMRGNLDRLKLVAAIATYGAPRIGAWWFGDPTRRFVKQQLTPMATRRAAMLYLARYSASRTDAEAGKAFIENVGKKLARAIRSASNEANAAPLPHALPS